MACVTLAPACAITDSLSGSEQVVLMYSGCEGRGELKYHRASRLGLCVCAGDRLGVWGNEHGVVCEGWCVWGV